MTVAPHKHEGPKDKPCKVCGKGFWAMANMRMIHTNAK